MDTLKIEITSRCRVEGREVQPGAVVNIDMEAAETLLGSGRGRLVDPAGMQRLNAHRAAVQRRSLAGGPQAGPRW